MMHYCPPPISSQSDYARGFYAATDRIENLINSLDETDAKKVRSAIYRECMTMLPTVPENAA